MMVRECSFFFLSGVKNGDGASKRQEGFNGLTWSASSESDH
jgi:hypothetical protein